jgi:hypothetical protein
VPLFHPADDGRLKEIFLKISSLFKRVINPYPQALIIPRRVHPDGATDNEVSSGQMNGVCKK